MIKCNGCNVAFEQKDALQMHIQAKHSEKYHQLILSYFKKKKVDIWTIIIFIIILLGTGIFFLVQQNPEPKPTFVVPQGPIHWHPHLKIIINGKEQIIPANIGLDGGHKPMHTHDENGTIHVENKKPTARSVVLGYFFEIWGEKFNKNCVFDYCTDTGILTMTVNGKENYDFEDYFMHDKDDIVIEYQSN